MNKLYTEEQVRIMLGKARLLNMDDTEMFTDDYLIEQQTPIQLPTDEEIEEASNKLGYGSRSVGIIHNAFQVGAIWMRDKIKGGDNE